MRHLGRVLTEILGVVDRALGPESLPTDRQALLFVFERLRTQPPELIRKAAWSSVEIHVREIIRALAEPEKGQALAIWTGEEPSPESAPSSEPGACLDSDRAIGCRSYYGDGAVLAWCRPCRRRHKIGAGYP